MEESRKSVGVLSETTTQLRQILSSSQSRGQWGERMVEDILNFIGLSEGINFDKRFNLEKIDPNFTFVTDGKRLNMDVKFPLNHYEKYLSSEIESLKENRKSILARCAISN